MTPSPSRVASRYLLAQVSAETEIAEALEALSATFLAASEAGLSTREEASLRNGFAKFVDNLPPEVARDLRGMAKLGSTTKSANPLFLAVIAGAASASAKKHRQGQYTQQYTQQNALMQGTDKVLGGAIEAYLDIEAAVSNISKRIGGFFSKLYQKLRGSRPTPKGLLDLSER